MNAPHRVPPLRATPIELSKTEIANYSIARAAMAAQLESTHSTLERDITLEIAKRAGEIEPDSRSITIPWCVLAAAQKRDLTATPGSAGGYLVATAVGQYEPINRPVNVLELLGANVLDGVVGNVQIPRGGSGPTIEWLPTEASAPNETPNLSLGSIACTPKTAAGFVDLSYAMRKTSPVAEQVAMRELLAAALEAELRAALSGSGAAGQPTGIINTAGIGAFNGASITFANAREAELDVLANSSARSGIVGFVAAPTVADVLSKRDGKTADRALWEGPLARGTVNGNPAISTTAMPASTLLVGDFGRVTILRWRGGLTLRINPYQAFSSGITRAAVFHTVDVAVHDAAAFTLATSVS